MTQHHLQKLPLLLIVIVSTLSAYPGSTRAETPKPGSQPNILLLLSEDHGKQLGCYGDKTARTPNLDRLASQGLRFDNAYVVQAGCSPSRAALLTGLYPHQNGQIGLATHRMRLYRPDTPNLPSILHKAGYRTALIGKLHINPESAFHFDSRVSIETFNKRDVIRVADEAQAVFEHSDQPFFLQISYADAHSPYAPKQSDGGLPHKRQTSENLSAHPILGYSSPTIKKTLAEYYDSLSRLDTGIGQVLQALEVSGKSDNTLVIFMSDHGPQWIRGKMTCYEGGLQIPLIVRYHGLIKPGSTNDSLVHELDLAPTILELAGVKAPEHWPGKSMLPLFTKRDKRISNNFRELLFTEFTLHWPVTYFPQRAVRDDRYKLIKNLMPEIDNPICQVYLHEKVVPTITPDDMPRLDDAVLKSVERFNSPPAYELYDLKDDPWERVNLANDPQHQDVLNQLNAALSKWQTDTDDPLRHPEVLQAFTDEVRATFTGPAGGYEHVGKKKQFKWRYPNYFVSAMRADTRRTLGLTLGPQGAPGEN